LQSIHKFRFMRCCSGRVVKDSLVLVRLGGVFEIRNGSTNCSLWRKGPGLKRVLKKSNETRKDSLSG
jgi:hypothetical protein